MSASVIINGRIMACRHLIQNRVKSSMMRKSGEENRA